MKLSKSNFLDKIQKGYSVIATPAGNVPVTVKGLSVVNKNTVTYKNNELRVMALLNPKTSSYVPIDAIVDETVNKDIKSISITFPQFNSRWHTDIALYVYSKLIEKFRGTKVKVSIDGDENKSSDYRVYIGPNYWRYDEPHNVKIAGYHFLKAHKNLIKSLFKKFDIDVSNFDAELNLVLSLHNYALSGENVTEFEDYYNHIMWLLKDSPDIVLDGIKNEYGSKDPFCIYFVFNSILAEAASVNLLGESKGMIQCSNRMRKYAAKAKNIDVPLYLYVYVTACKEHYTPKDAQLRNIGLPINVLSMTFFSHRNVSDVLELSTKVYPDGIFYIEPTRYTHVAFVRLCKKSENLGYTEFVDFLLKNRTCLDGKANISIDLSIC